MTIESTPELGKAVFLDRDGVLVYDRDQIMRTNDFQLIPGVPEALGRLASAGFKLVVVTNQPIVARGNLTERGLADLHRWLVDHIVSLGGPRIDLVKACPHHPNANVDAYRRKCRCRKPGPALLEFAARDLRLDPAQSWLIGDRPSDIAAGRQFNVRTILVESGRHKDPPIEGAENIGDLGLPHHRAPTLTEAVSIVLGAGA